MTTEEILEADKLIAGMRDDLSLIAGSSNDADKLICLMRGNFDMRTQQPLFHTL
jgi:hypothetical protein